MQDALCKMLIDAAGGTDTLFGPVLGRRVGTRKGIIACRQVTRTRNQPSPEDKTGKLNRNRRPED